MPRKKNIISELDNLQENIIQDLPGIYLKLLLNLPEPSLKDIKENIEIDLWKALQIDAEAFSKGKYPILEIPKSIIFQNLKTGTEWKHICQKFLISQKEPRKYCAFHYMLNPNQILFIIMKSSDIPNYIYNYIEKNAGPFDVPETGASIYEDQNKPIEVKEELKEQSEIKNVSIWRLKYRPQRLTDIKAIYPQIADIFQGYINQNNFPHLLLVGPKGSGKTVLAEILAHEIFNTVGGFNNYFKLVFADDPLPKDRNIVSDHINASHIGHHTFLDKQIRPFVSSQKIENIPFKILCIKNFHILDTDQNAFRRIMERYSTNCRMILITDCVSSIIDPIISRCQVIFVPYLNDQAIQQLILQYCQSEQVSITTEAITFVQNLFHKNPGRILDFLQLTYLDKKDLSLKSLKYMAQTQSSSLVKDLIIKMQEQDFKMIRILLREILQKHALSKTEILSELSEILTKLPLNQANKYLEVIACSDFEGLNTTDDEIQLESLLSKLSLIKEA